MVNYEVIVHTGDCKEAATFNDVSITLVGQAGQSECTLLKTDKKTSPFAKGAVSCFAVSCPESLGDLTWIKLKKQRHHLYPEVDWFLDKVEVKSDQKTYIFPIYCWIADSEEHCFSEGTACIGQSSPEGDIQATYQTLSARLENTDRALLDKKEKYKWRKYKEKLPYCIDADNITDLPLEVWFNIHSLLKTADFIFSAVEGMAVLKLSKLGDCKDKWPSYEDISRALTCCSTDMTNYIQQHWKDDAFFAYQFLNGVNPMMIQRCTALPDNFPVKNDMVYMYLHKRSLEDEMKNGNIFLCDYKNLDGLTANTINGKQQFLTAPLVLLHKTPEDKLMPVAIQLKQTPGDDNPIFVPTDPCWLLAKTFVRCADFTEHELNFHLLRTHLLAEVFAVSLLRNFRRKHPLFKLLMPHTRYTLQINILARQHLISEDGVFMKFTACGGEALTTILQRSLSSLTYRSLCIQDNIADRGLESLQNFRYRDFGFKLWDTIYRFVQGILFYYYKNVDEVLNDHDLQSWIGDIFEHGFLSQESTGIPKMFSTVDELVKFVTMVIFTCTAQHSAVNNGQYDYGAWMPNTPMSLQCPPPPTKKNLVVTEDTLLQTALPDINVTVHGMAILWLLSKPSLDFESLGNYHEEYFCEEIPKKLIQEFQTELKNLSTYMEYENAPHKIAYKYLDPAVIENSVAL